MAAAVASVVVVLAGVNLWAELQYSLYGRVASGTVVEFHHTSARSRSVTAEVDVQLSGTPTFRWEVDDSLGVESWEEGGRVPLLCTHIHADHWSCVLDDVWDRYPVPLAFLAVGILIVVVAMRRRTTAPLGR
jgi:hypothetical protein